MKRPKNRASEPPATTKEIVANSIYRPSGKRGELNGPQLTCLASLASDLEVKHWGAYILDQLVADGLPSDALSHVRTAVRNIINNKGVIRR